MEKRPLIIGVPAGAYFDNRTKHIVKADGEAVTDQWVIIASEDYITGIDDLKDSKDLNYLNDSTYNLAGQKVGKDYKGIVIQGGKKLLKK